MRDAGNGQAEHRAWAAVLLPLCLLILAASGCRKQPAPEPVPPPGPQGEVMRPKENYWPNFGKPRSFVMDFGGWSEPATVTSHSNPRTRETEVTISSAGQSLTEHYAIDDTGISFVGAGGDRFTPPIRLIEYGQATGATRRWSGLNASSGEPPLRAVARVAASDELTRLPIGTLSTVKVSVSVALPDRQTGQDMTFWFAPGEGLVKASLNGYTRSARSGT